MDIDMEQFKKEIVLYNDIASALTATHTEEELNAVLKRALHRIGAIIPWKGYQSFDAFMNDKQACLVFE